VNLQYLYKVLLGCCEAFFYYSFVKISRFLPLKGFTDLYKLGMLIQNIIICKHGGVSQSGIAMPFFAVRAEIVS
jgi:hypothetical protein